MEDFKKIAEQFCVLVDSVDRTDRNSFLFQLYLILPDLIKGAACLPKVSYEDDPEEEDFVFRSYVTMRDSEWGQLYTSLKKKLDPYDIYWILPNCWKNSESLKESLADDIADIYRDLKNGLNIQDIRDMVHHWRLLFYSHWGDHALGALKAIHELTAECEMD